MLLDDENGLSWTDRIPKVTSDTVSGVEKFSLRAIFDFALHQLAAMNSRKVQLPAETNLDASFWWLLQEKIAHHFFGA